MKVTAQGDILTKTFKRCQLGGPGAHLNPVHQLVKLEAKRGDGGSEAGSLRFTATTGLLQIDTSIKAFVEEPGLLAANCRDLGNASGAMPLGATKIVGTDKRVQLSASGRRWSGGSSDPTVIGATPEPKGLPWVGMPVAALRAALERVSHATADVRGDEKSIDGVLIRAEAGAVTAVGTSGRMCVVLEQKADVRLKTLKRWEALIPTIALAPLREILDEASEADEAGIGLYSDGQMLFMEGPSTLVIAALPHGQYAPWELVLTQFPKEPLCTLPRLALIESIKALQATSSKLDPGAMFDLVNGDVVLSRKDPDNEYNDSIPAPEMRPNLNMRFMCAPSYFLSCLKSADEDPTLAMGEDGRMVLMATTGGYRAAISLMDAGA
jgi:DNA polymerase III sliding clamp (beta) subunit (PCNA family)